MTLEFTFYAPTKIIFGRGSVAKVGEEAKKLGDKALIVCGRTFARKSGYLAKLTKLLEEAGVKVAVFDKVEPNPATTTVDAGAEVARKEDIEVIIAFGGGSAMDAAKGIAVVTTLGGKCRDYLLPYIVEDEVLPIIAIPTTCGTGSEVTRYAVITVPEEKYKGVIVGYPIIPQVALVDPETLTYLPPKLVAYTAFDALSHAVEALWSKKSQPLSDLVALESIKIIFDSLLRAYKKEVEALEELHYASLLAGIAINAAGTTVVHGAGYYLTTHRDLHHGLANALLLPYAILLNEEYAEDKIRKMRRIVGAESTRGLVHKLLNLMKETETPTTLKEVGVTEEEIDSMVKDSLRYKRNLANNPRPISEKELRELYEMALKGVK